jgi:integrase
MPLPMTRPTPHPKTGVYWLRKAVPTPLRSLVGKVELVASLQTKDPREARERAVPVLARFNAILAAARAGGIRLTQREVEALAGSWYRAAAAHWGDNPGDAGDWAMAQALLGDRLEDAEGDPEVLAARRLIPKAEDRTEAERLLREHGYLADPDTVDRLAVALLRAKVGFYGQMQRQAEGDWRPDHTVTRFPPLQPRQAAPTSPEAGPKAPPKGITIPALIAAWAAEAGTTGKALYDRERTGKLLADHLGHDDASRVTADDVVAWKAARLASGRSVKTVANDIGELRPIWKWGKANRKLAFAENPFAGLAPRAKKRGRRARDPFTESEAASILVAARQETDASLRWLPWLACFTGARIGELAQSAKEDVQRIGPDGPWFLHLHAEGDGRTLKTPHSERQVPLHPALVAEGFLQHVAALPVGSPILPDLRPDKFGSRGGTATKKHGRWLRKVVGITDARKDPAHAWRHRFEDQARRAGLPQNVTDGLLGHLNPMNESEGYGRGFRFMPDVTAPWVAKMASPLETTSTPAQPP